MDIKKIVVIAALALLAIIGYNYYSSAQSEKARTARMAETEALRASIPQPPATKTTPSKEVLAEKTPDIAVQPTPAASDVEVFSAPIPEKVEPEKKLDNSMCDSVIPVAEKVMRARQDGIAISNALDFANGIKDGTPATEAVSRITKQMVIEAYSMPSFSTDSYKDDAVREFGAKQYLACMRAFS
ncbi:hypothetical protein ACTXMF_12090 [Psychrobacter celer]|uniref:hypothetical protein n=1 Tax=Psychrobacter celer TaxID=306572 RepID=UPI003FD357DD